MQFNDEFLNEEIEENDNNNFYKSIINQYNIIDNEDNEKNRPDNNIININPLKDDILIEEQFNSKLEKDINKESKNKIKNKNKSVEKDLKYVDILLNNKKNQKVKINNNVDIKNYNNLELNEKEIEMIKKNINFDKNDELDKNDPFGDLSNIIKKKILSSKKVGKNDENYGYKKRKEKINSSKNLNNYSIPINKKYAYSDKNVISKVNFNIKNTNINKNIEKKKIINDEQVEKNSYKNIYKNKINNNKKNIKEVIDESLTDIII